MSAKVFLSCGGCKLAIQNNRLVLLEPHDVAHTWELGYRPDPYSNDPYWILRYPAADLQLELRPDKREIAWSPRRAPSVDYVEVARGDVVREKLRFAPAANSALLALEVTEDGRNNIAAPVLIRTEANDSEAKSEVDVFYVLLNATFDYVVVGSSFCCWAFVKETLLHNPDAKILILERGGADLSKHQQSLPSRGEGKTASKMAVLPWSVFRHGAYITNIHGQIPFLGGRSPYWSGWCPEPSEADLRDWPEPLKQKLRPYLAKAKDFLGVIPANKVKDADGLYGPLQGLLLDRFKSTLQGSVTGISGILPAPLAMGNKGNEKFSTPNPLGEIRSANVQTVLDCVVQKIIHDGKKATHLQTSQGNLPLHNAKLILAMSTLPSTTLVLNSFNDKEFPDLANVGKRFTAHFISSAIARVPRNKGLPVPPSGQGVQLGAVYIAGKGEAQYHLQVSAVATSDPGSKDLELCRQFSANSIPEACTSSSPNHVLVSCSALGELDHKNKDNWFRLKEDDQSDLTSNGELQVVPNGQDLRLWDTMDDVMFKAMEGCLSSPDDKVEYWHEKEREWKTERPTTQSIRQKNAAHDASTMWIGEDGDKEAPVGLDYRLRGVENVYITGGALWPTGGSWNPVLTIVAMATHLADQLCNVDVKKNDG